jgi:hypothetical protein
MSRSIPSHQTEQPREPTNKGALAPFYFASQAPLDAAAARSAPVGARRKCRDGRVPEHRAADERQNEAVEAGTYEYAGVEYPRIQFLTAEDVLVCKREFHMPTRVNTKIGTGQQSLAL